MLQRSNHNRSKRACPVCARRKVKCDRLVPCSNCVKRGQESECIKFVTNKSAAIAANSESEYLPSLLQLWQSYEYWVMEIGLFKTKDITEGSRKKVSIIENLSECTFWQDCLNTEQSYSLLNFSVENLGPLFFGCIVDINELFTQLERYWRRRDKESRTRNTFNDTVAKFDSDDYLWDALLWSVFTLSFYYMPVNEISKIFPLEPICEHLNIDVKQEWTESLQLLIYERYLKVTTTLLMQSDFMNNPNIKFIQVYLILSNTTLQINNNTLSDSLLLQCIQVAKFFNIDFHKQYAEDDPFLGISKETFGKIWFKLCIIDYYQSGPAKKIYINNEIPSLLQHAAFYQDMPNFNIYKKEDNFESFCWKIVSLERDLDQYLVKSFKPQIKTFDAIKRELEIFNKKLDFNKKPKKKSNEISSINTQFENFLLLFLLNLVSWKLQKMCLIHFETADSLSLSMHYSQNIIQLLIKNVSDGNYIFNKHPWVLKGLSRIISFYSYYNIFVESPEIEQLYETLSDLLSVLPLLLGKKVNNLKFLIVRLNKLGVLWEKVNVVGSLTGSIHPVFKILQNDIKAITRANRKVSVMTNAMHLLGRNDAEEGSGEDEELMLQTESEEFRLIVSQFEAEHDISEIISI
ncbi:hypothetical protein KAFR_0B04830 [Kazachstania africana CBS 2517]|uniref:Zn(2)-C6 fungal-type domain-containing protein n=1 Tax=Kazachstania africana (strain ATCC 22294 / BCRC 22015 / CBS 2517 / CECT 1963 / NBRC 1671 / NRRL Y-8276) TaxID=1071382 RepID=H2AQX9_KAZAF|nr:hypothetical protein KAFR_0B04830 [Kazachstania africana CBS 2517]CCF56779.1 hypothetical protein KAFR_0B04830 [Kazachstania africana CBS 2517]